MGTTTGAVLCLDTGLAEVFIWSTGRRGKYQECREQMTNRQVFPQRKSFMRYGGCTVGIVRQLGLIRAEDDG